MTTLTRDAEGKTVVDDTGEEIGTVVEVRDGRAYVDPDPGITDKIMAKLGWGDRDEDTYPLDADDVERIGDGEVRLRRRR